MSDVAPPLHRRFAPMSIAALAFLVPLALFAIVAGFGVLGRPALSWLSADSSRQSSHEPAPSPPSPMTTDSKAAQQIPAAGKQPTGATETPISIAPTAVVPTAAAVTALAYSEEGRLLIGESVERGALTDWRFESPSGGAAESRKLRLTTRLTTGSAIRSGANDGASSGASSGATASVSAIRFARDGRWLAVGVRGGVFNGLHLFERDGDGGWKFVRLVSPFGPSSVAFLERTDSLSTSSPSPRQGGGAPRDGSTPTPTAATTGEGRFATSHVAAAFMDARRDAVVSAWRLPSLELEPTPPLVATPLKAMTTVRGEAPRLVAGGRSGQLFWCDAALPGFMTTATLPAVRCLAASLDGQWVAVGGGAELELWRIDPAGDGAARRRGHAPFVRVGRLKRAAEQLVFSADARFLFVASDDMQEPAIHIIDCAKVSTARSIPTPGGAVSVLALSPDGRWLATAGGVQGVAVWDAARLVGGL